jgi:hypothetical protein
VFASLSNVLFIGFLPLLGAAFMIFTFVENLFGDGLSNGTKEIGIGGLAIGLIPMVYYMVKKVPYYSRSERLASEDDLGVLAEVAA